MPEPLSARHVHLDPVGGIAGDMFVAALVDAFPALAEHVLAEIGRVLPAALASRPRLEVGTSAGLRALRFLFAAGSVDAGPIPPLTYPELARVVGQAGLAPDAARHALAILRILAEAEARVHGVPVEEVHFHELADWDSLVDVVAAGAIAAALAGASWSVAELPLGGGAVITHHGCLPVPAPATVAILEGFGWRDDGIPGERVTPTGAAILRHLVPAPGAAPRPAGRLAGSGAGAGTRELPGLPNLLRALVFAEPANEAATTVAVLEFEVDDMTGEEIGVGLDLLRNAHGVLDASVDARLGKKGRPLQGFRVLALPEAVDAVERLCFVETSTLGVRRRLEQRTVLSRLSEKVMPEGAAPLRVKRAERPGGEVTVKAESDDVADVPGLAARRRRRAEAERRALEEER